MDADNGRGLRGWAALPYNTAMDMVRYIYWQDGSMWLGYVEEYPDYRTQGETLEELQENLRDILADLRSGAIASVRRVGELQIA